MARDKDDLWRNFPRTAIEFERRFATEEACRAYWVEARWGGEPACARCGSKRGWAGRGGFLLEWGDGDPQTSLPSGPMKCAICRGAIKKRSNAQIRSLRPGSHN